MTFIKPLRLWVLLLGPEGSESPLFFERRGLSSLWFLRMEHLWDKPTNWTMLSLFSPVDHFLPSVSGTILLISGVFLKEEIREGLSWNTNSPFHNTLVASCAFSMNMILLMNGIWDPLVLDKPSHVWYECKVTHSCTVSEEREQKGLLQNRRKVLASSEFLTLILVNSWWVFLVWFLLLW